MPESRKVVVTGGGGYVGAVLIPRLLAAGHVVRVIDLFLYGVEVLDSVKDHPQLTLVKGDIRDQAILKQALEGCQVLIHLACISNDPSFELNPELGKSINLDAFRPLIQSAKSCGLVQCIYASSSSVYGVKNEPHVTENLPLEPLTDYSRFKADCEKILLDESSNDFFVTIVRPSTVCGYSPRLRLDLTVNILTHHAVNKGKITVFGGDQMRPNIHIEDMTKLYEFLLEVDPDKIHQKTYNVGYQNYPVQEIAQMVKSIVGEHVSIVTTPSNDNRSYHVSAEKIKTELGFTANQSVEKAITDLQEAFKNGLVPNPDTDKRYYNVKLMKENALQ